MGFKDFRDERIIPGDAGGPNVIKRKTAAQEDLTTREKAMKRRDCGDVSTSQGMLATTRSWKRPGMHSPQDLWREHGPWFHRAFSPAKPIPDLRPPELQYSCWIEPLSQGHLS